MKRFPFQWLCLAISLALYSAGVLASKPPWRAVDQADLEGIWSQVGVVVLDPESDPEDPWFRAKQFFRFPADGGFKHVLVNPDSEPEPSRMPRRAGNEDRPGDEAERQ